MIYLTGQLLFFLLVTAFLGFIVGWLLRGAMLPLSMLEGNDYKHYSIDAHADNTRYQFANQENAGSFAEPEHTEPSMASIK